ncbi:hypothetical protein ES703_81050 [subsurface metagenome]
MITEEGEIDAVAVGIVAVGIVPVIALEQDMMRPHHMAGVQPRLDPVTLGVDVAHVHVVVANHRACAGGPHHEHLVGADRDAVLDQDLGRAG